MLRKCSAWGLIGLSPLLVATGCDSSTPMNVTASDSGTASDGTTSTLYARLGGHAGIRSALDQVVQAELVDPEIASFFFNQVQSPVPAGHPTVDQLTECLTDQLANAAGGTEPFPTTVTDTAGSFTCRDMATIHRPLHISGGTFDKFVVIAAGELRTLGVAAADIQMVGSVLTSTKSAIVDPNLADAGELPYPSDAADAGAEAGGDSAVTTLYQRLGGHAGIRSALDQVVQAELGDPAIASFFFNQVATPVPVGHPNVDQLTECLTDQLSSAAGGPETYPATVSDDAGSFTCRDMISIHQPLHISGGTFDKFVVIAAGELQTLGVAATDIQTIGSVLTSTKSAIVDPNLADGGEMPYDAGSDASTTLYQRLGGHTGIRSALDQVVQAELGDPAIASFFFNQVQSPVPAGHPNVDQLTECLTDQLAGAAGGPETYPTTVTDDAGSFTCRDMAAIHQPLHISGGTFDKFVVIAAGELQTLGVAAPDIQTIGAVLNSTKTAIVDPNLADAGERPYDAGGQ